jgi:hypothetical protein
VKRSLRYLTLKTAFFLRVSNGTVRRHFGKFIGKRSCDVIFGELPRARRAGITNFRTANMVFCAAFNCRNSSKSGVSFFSFPLRDEKRCKEWLRLMKRKDFTPTAASKLCSAHFSPQCFEQNLALRATLGSPVQASKTETETRCLTNDF